MKIKCNHLTNVSPKACGQLAIITSTSSLAKTTKVKPSYKLCSVIN